MTSVLMEETKERGPRLTVSVAEPASKQEFPSPSSSFIPPPIPGAHEFAIKPPPVGKHKRMLSNESNNSNNPPDNLLDTENSQLVAIDPSMASSPTTPTPFSSQSPRKQSDLFQSMQVLQPNATSTTQTLPDISRTLTPTSPNFNILSSGIHNPNRDSTASSLSSNRPAPPSPAVSRRTSTVLSRANSSRKAPAHRLSMQSATSKRDSLSSAQAPITATSSSSISRRSLRPQPKVYIKIRDFGYPETDERHVGMGTDIPKPNRMGFLNKHLRSNSTSSSSTTSEDERDEQLGEEEDEAWNSFQWGMGRLSWQFSQSGPADRPSSNDFDRNFNEDPSQLDNEEYLDDEQEEGPLHPGLYRAMYAFEPEGTAEMALLENQVVRVIGRGGGVGWAVVDKAYVGENAPDTEPGEGHALVPESYLEAIKLDWPDDDDQEDE